MPNNWRHSAAAFDYETVPLARGRQQSLHLKAAGSHKLFNMKYMKCRNEFELNERVFGRSATFVSAARSRMEACRSMIDFVL